MSESPASTDTSESDSDTADSGTDSKGIESTEMKKGGVKVTVPTSIFTDEHGKPNYGYVTNHIFIGSTTGKKTAPATPPAKSNDGDTVSMLSMLLPTLSAVLPGIITAASLNLG